MKVLEGVVISDRMEKTVVVLVKSWWKHPLYKKRIRREKKFKADNQVKAKEGDKVQIQEARPLSKEKRWKIIKVLKSED